MTPMLLAIDTATRQASLALFDGKSLLGETSWLARENHTTTLLPEIDRLLARTAQSFDTLRAISISLGPGSFTSLRVGLSVAKGLALTRHLPIVGVPTLDTVAYAQRNVAEKIIAVIFAGRGRFSAARYHSDRETVERVSDFFLGSVAELIAWAQASREELLFSGEIDDALRAQIEEHLPGGRVAEPASRLRRAGYLAEMAWTRFVRGESDELATLAPLYLPTASVPLTK